LTSVRDTKVGIETIGLERGMLYHPQKIPTAQEIPVNQISVFSCLFSANSSPVSCLPAGRSVILSPKDW